ELALVCLVQGRVQVSAQPPAMQLLLAALKAGTPLARLDADALAQLPALAAAGALVPATGDGR
ncbi:hypothetical protein, partial [Sandarakinorhabdus rubra]|uniref:hypothetical protein n=1 Tax=Sandarakinorhabdus rubra TaxID=2672568 RepID=UPI0013D939ED